MQKAQNTQGSYEALVTIIEHYYDEDYNRTKLADELLALNIESLGEIGNKTYMAIADEVGTLKYNKICENIASHTVFTGILTNDIKNLEIYYRCIVMFFRKNKASTIPTIIDRAQIGTDMYFWTKDKINPLGPWTGGIDVDCGCTNRKLGSDMGDGVTGGGLMGKDLSKADVSVNIVCYLKAVASGQVVTAICSIGDENVTFTYADGRRETERFADIVEQARLYILTDCGGSFEKFAEWGLLRPLAQIDN